jgi:small-conductance mechanosensitive channel
MRIPGFVAAMALAACFHAGPAAALTPEQATSVGGDLTSAGKKLAALQEAGAKVIDAAPGSYGELEAALGRIHDSRGKRDITTNTWLGIASLALLWVAVTAFRHATARARERCLNDALRARGAASLFAYEVASWAMFAVGAYAVIEFCFDAGGNQELLWVGILWALVRWRLFMLLIEVVLRPKIPAFRLIAMSTGAARQIKAILAVVILIGLVGISVMPVLLRAGLPIPSGQVIVLLQGLVVAAGSALALWRYRASHTAAGDWSRPRRLWFGFGIAVMLVLWLSWTVAVLSLEFSVYHSLVWSLRIAAFAYVVDQMLGLSSGARWALFLQRSITAAAVLAIAILLAETWLVDEFALIAPATWLAVRRSLITAGLTLFIGYVAWRYLHHWTEERLRASATGMTGPDSEEEGAHPASRLTTILPMLRILAGIAILVIVVLLALSQLGVEITPLLAGAGVFGLAISFGSQALVRDVVSGIFFMADDAFRVGEYIDTGRLKGTVERISLRSVRLRHQNGQIHTIPFGQLTSISNFSRDWQTVKFNLRLARDTDIEKVRKTVKQLGQEMMKDPELARELLQPLKLQGVAEIADSALVVRLKFTVRPLKPTWVQREALKRIYRVFREKGIEFASGAITVQTSGRGGAPHELAAGAAAGMAAEAEAAAQRQAG